jgi:transcriptional regulator with XRE-family HTH domain
MKASRSKTALPLPASRALVRLGEEVSIARRRRRISVALMSERALISRNTLTRVEKGDPTVSMGAYATVLFILGMTDRLGQVADPALDKVGLSLEETRLPKRIRAATGPADGT